MAPQQHPNINHFNTRFLPSKDRNQILNIYIYKYIYISLNFFRNIWSISNYFSCLSPNYLANCSYLTIEDVSAVKAIVDLCIPHRKELISCLRECNDCIYCKKLPQNCSSVMIFDLFYRILPKDLNAKPIYINAFLPIFTLTGYRSRGFYNATLAHFIAVQNDLRSFSKSNPHFVLKGSFM